MLTYEILTRLSLFLLVFAGLAVWEWQRPRRPLALTRRQRWPHNLALLLVDIIVLRLLFPVCCSTGRCQARSPSVLP